MRPKDVEKVRNALPRRNDEALAAFDRILTELERAALDNYWAGRCSQPGLHGPCGAKVESYTCSNGHTAAVSPTTHLRGFLPEVLSEA